MHINHEIQWLLIHPRMDRKTYQQFMDDTMLMGHPSIQEARNIKTFLTNFGKALGLEVNEKKSHVFFFKSLRIIRRNICQILGFQESPLPSKYLGAPLMDSMMMKGS